MTSYAALTDVRTYGIAAPQAEDAIVVDRLELASRIIDGYTGTIFTQQVATAVTLNDVRIPVVVLPSPFANVTAVTLNGQVLASTQYVIEPWGLRLYRSGNFDVDGFPVDTMNDWGVMTPPRSRWGAQVIVTADFGWATVPSPVRHATVLV